MSSTHPHTSWTARTIGHTIAVVATSVWGLVIITAREAQRQCDRQYARLATSAARLRTEPDAGYSSETVVVTSLLVGVAVVIFGSIFWNDITSFAKTIFNDISHA